VRLPRKRWGVILSVRFPDGHEATVISPRRCWTRKGAASEAVGQLAECKRVRPDAAWTCAVKRLAPVPDLYADRYWRGDTYVGPEI
jgi:hypothetical protein